MSDIGVDSPRDSTESKSVQICEDPNSRAHLEALFNVLSQDQNIAVPMIKRQLPDSFFSPSKDKFGNPRLGPPVTVGPSTRPGEHNRSMSVPISLDARSSQFPLDNAVQGPLPPGWEIARTPDGLSYFIE